MVEHEPETAASGAAFQNKKGGAEAPPFLLVRPKSKQVT
jgi:hypothetical protein